MEPTRDDAVLEVVGEPNYQQALERLGGGRTIDGVLQTDHLAGLIREPSNRYDRNAIRVDINGKLVGYLSREQALAYKGPVEALMAQGRVLVAKARLTGGWDSSIEVILHIGSPAECMFELMDVASTIRNDHPWAGQVVAFTGDSTCRIGGFALDRPASVALAERAGMTVHPRLTKRVQLLVDCDRSSASGNEQRAREYGIPVVDEAEFWATIGVAAERASWSNSR